MEPWKLVAKYEDGTEEVLHTFDKPERKYVPGRTSSYTFQHIGWEWTINFWQTEKYPNRVQLVASDLAPGELNINNRVRDFVNEATAKAFIEMLEEAIRNLTEVKEFHEGALFDKLMGREL